MQINPDLLQLAQWRLAQMANTEKQAFQPPVDPSQDPAAAAAGGAPPMDPSMAGGGAPPMDPSMAGGAPPAGMPAPAPAPGGDPMAGGGGLTADSVRQIVQQTMQQSGMGAGGGAGGGAGAGKAAKPDLAVIAMDVFQTKKLIMAMFNQMGMPLPPDILDGPNRDPSTGMPMMPGAPGSTSDPAQMQQQAQQQQAAGGGGGGAQGGAIPAIQPMQAAGGSVGGGEKQGIDKALYIGEPSYLSGFDKIVSKSAALHAIGRRLGTK